MRKKKQKLSRALYKTSGKVGQYAVSDGDQRDAVKVVRRFESENGQDTFAGQLQCRLQ